MSGLAAAIDWGSPSASTDKVRAMLDAMPHRAPDGSWVAETSHCALGFALRATTRRERAAAQPLHDSERGLWIAGDARIDNRDELAAALGTAVPDSDIELLLQGYAKWGVELASRLYGDFAFVLWNERERSLYAARDAFGLRPLFYHRAGSRLLVASEVDALLATGDVSFDLENGTVADFLALNRYQDSQRTFFRDVKRVQPGHWLLATAERFEERRYFRFPTGPCTTSTEPEDAEEFRRRFRRAVADRLDAETPIVSELSGGLDSASIACMADAIVREGEARPPVILASAVYPGFSCDEREYIEAVHARVKLRHEMWDATAEPPLPEEPRPLAGPWLDDAAFASPGARRRAQALGARVVLSGIGGDELLFESAVYRDLGAHWRLARLARETLFTQTYTASPRRTRFFEGLRAVVPSSARRAYRFLRPLPRPAPPPWLGPALEPRWRAEPSVPRPEPAPSQTQASTWAWLTSPTAVWHLEIAELFASREGLQLRCPFFDRRLAEHVLSIPWHRRLPSGRTKRLLRDAMGGLLPTEIAERRRVTGFDDLFSWLGRRVNFPSDPAPNEERSGLAGFVRWSAVRQAGERARDGVDDDWTSLAELRNIAVLESWLRALERAKRRRLGMSEKELVERSPEATPEKHPEQSAKGSYQPPTVERLGNLRDLLGKSGLNPDNNHAQPRRP